MAMQAGYVPHEQSEKRCVAYLLVLDRCGKRHIHNIPANRNLAVRLGIPESIINSIMWTALLAAQHGQEARISPAQVPRAARNAASTTDCRKEHHEF